MWATSLRSLARSAAAWLHPLRRIARPATSHRIAPHRGSARVARFAAHTGRHSSSRSPARSAKRSCGVTPFAFLTLHLMRDGSTRFACSVASLAAPMTRSHCSLRAAYLVWRCAWPNVSDSNDFTSLTNLVLDFIHISHPDQTVRTKPCTYDQAILCLRRVPRTRIRFTDQILEGTQRVLHWDSVCRGTVHEMNRATLAIHRRPSHRAQFSWMNARLKIGPIWADVQWSTSISRKRRIILIRAGVSFKVGP
jgi:hypothetical protein